MMSDKCAPALDVSVEEQDSFGSFGEDSVQTLLSLALADPERAKERFPAYRLTRLVTARFDMDDTEARIFADLARPLATVRLLHGTAPFNDHLRDAIERFGLTSLFCDNGPGRHHHAICPPATIITLMLSMRGALERWRSRAAWNSENSKANRIETMERSRGIWTNLFGGSKKNSEENSEK
jgi:hypothetical protein